MKRPTLQQTIINMIDFHNGQVDKSGVAYFNHPVRVMVRLGPDATEAERHAALLHDVVEDTPITLEILEDLGYSQEVLDLVKLLTNVKPETHRGYIFRIIGSGNYSAMRIKLADLYDNSNETRNMRCQDEVVRKMLLDMTESRYKPAIRLMKEALGAKAQDIISEDVEVDILESEILEDANV